MSVDLSQFHQVFFEESFEGLDIMESQLVDMSPETVDDEIVNTIFRAAHSIKGGAGTFGFMPVSEFTHVVETLLDEIRAGKRAMESEYIDLFLQSVDCLREMLGAMQAGNAPETARPAEIKVAFEAILNAGAPKAKNEEVASDGVNAESEMIGWRIEMRPHIDMLRTGNEPFRMFRELRDVVGEEYLNVEAHLENLPEFTSINPEECYIYWTLTINTPANIDYIRAVFEWVEDDCDIEYHEIHNENAELSKPTDIAVESPEISSDAVDSVDAASSEPVAPPAAKSASPKATPKNAESSSIRVSIDKVDSLINMVGELVITQSMLGQLGQDFDMSRLAKLQEGLSQLEQNTRELQESVMKIRMMPISFAFSRFPRLVRDLGNQLSKKVNLVTLGENTELDKTVMEKIGDPLVHLVRNSLDHGLETTEQRIANGKSEEGTITLNAFHQGGNIVIEVADDGAGLNEQRILSSLVLLLSNVRCTLNNFIRLTRQIKNGIIACLNPDFASAFADTKILVTIKFATIQLIPELTILIARFVVSANKNAMMLTLNFIKAISHHIKKIIICS